MREIKFRQYIGCGFHYWGFFEDSPGAHWHWPDTSISMATGLVAKSEQYTGLKDNTKWEDLSEYEQAEWARLGKLPSEWNGKEIYDGDILHGREEGNGETTAWTDVYKIVFWNAISASFQCRDKDIKDGSCWCDSLEYFIDDYVVIGNIHENQELLK